jgi:hypothetical protein
VDAVDVEHDFQRHSVESVPMRLVGSPVRRKDYLGAGEEESYPTTGAGGPSKALDQKQAQWPNQMRLVETAQMLASRWRDGGSNRAEKG